MLYFNNIFANSEEFKEKFGTPEKRSNKLGLAILKSKAFRRFAHNSIMDGCPFTIWTPAQIQSNFYAQMAGASCRFIHAFKVIYNAFGSNEYNLDDYHGVDRRIQMMEGGEK